MRVVIATFADPGLAEAFSRALRDEFGIAFDAIGRGTVAAHREPHDGHQLVAAWIPRELAVDVRARATGYGGVLHEAPAPVAPPAHVTRSTVRGSPRPVDTDRSAAHPPPAGDSVKADPPS